MTPGRAQGQVEPDWIINGSEDENSYFHSVESQKKRKAAKMSSP